MQLPCSSHAHRCSQQPQCAKTNAHLLPNGGMLRTVYLACRLQDFSDLAKHIAGMYAGGGGCGGLWAKARPRASRRGSREVAAWVHIRAAAGSPGRQAGRQAGMGALHLRFGCCSLRAVSLLYTSLTCTASSQRSAACTCCTRIACLHGDPDWRLAVHHRPPHQPHRPPGHPAPPGGPGAARRAQPPGAPGVGRGGVCAKGAPRTPIVGSSLPSVVRRSLAARAALRAPPAQPAWVPDGTGACPALASFQRARQGLQRSIALQAKGGTWGHASLDERPAFVANAHRVRWQQLA